MSKSICPYADGTKVTATIFNYEYHDVSGELSIEDTNVYILHNNEKTQGDVANDRRGYSYSWRIAGFSGLSGWEESLSYYKVSNFKLSILKNGQSVKLGDLDYTVYKYYLSYGGSNETVFTKYLPGINKRDFVEAVVGYSKSGGFPELKNFEDLTKVYEALQDVIANPDNISKYMKDHKPKTTDMDWTKVDIGSAYYMKTSIWEGIIRVDDASEYGVIDKNYLDISDNTFDSDTFESTAWEDIIEFKRPAENQLKWFEACEEEGDFVSEEEALEEVEVVPDPGFKKGDYIVMLYNWSGPDFKKNCCFKQNKDSSCLSVELNWDGKANVSTEPGNGKTTIPFNDKTKWRYANEDEVAWYNYLEKPYNIAEIKFKHGDYVVCKGYDPPIYGRLNLEILRHKKDEIAHLMQNIKNGSMPDVSSPNMLGHKYSWAISPFHDISPTTKEKVDMYNAGKDPDQQESHGFKNGDYICYDDYIYGRLYTGEAGIGLYYICQDRVSGVTPDDGFDLFGHKYSYSITLSLLKSSCVQVDKESVDRYNAGENPKLKWEDGAYVEYLGTKSANNSNWYEYFGDLGVKAGDVGVIDSYHSDSIFVKDAIRGGYTSGALLKTDLKLITKSEYDSKYRTKEKEDFAGRWFTRPSSDHLTVMCCKSKDSAFGFWNNVWGRGWTITPESDIYKEITLVEAEDIIIEYVKRKYPTGTRLSNGSTLSYSKVVLDISGDDISVKLDDYPILTSKKSSRWEEIEEVRKLTPGKWYGTGPDTFLNYEWSGKSFGFYGGMWATAWVIEESYKEVDTHVVEGYIKSKASSIYPKNCYVEGKQLKNTDSVTVYLLRDTVKVYVDDVLVLTEDDSDWRPYTMEEEVHVTKDRRFEVGQKITYKSRKDCIHKRGHSDYYHGGNNQEGYVGTIISYGSYIPERGCYNIVVSSKGDYGYSMIESEFLEYDNIDTGFRSPTIEAEVFKKEVTKERKFISPKLK